MKTHIKYPSIEQFRNTVTYIKKVEFIGLDEAGEPIYDSTVPKPTITFEGTVKLHGTNAAVVLSDGEIYFQSRENIITPEADNAGFARWAEENKEALRSLFDTINSDITYDAIVIFGEWCGGSIQKEIALNKRPKAFYIFDIAGITFGEEVQYRWFNIEGLSSPDNGIYNISDYPSWKLTVDFNSPQDIQEELTKLALEVEEECPVAKAFGISGVGEGIVWKGSYNGERLAFKVKGEKHKISGTKNIASIAPDNIESINKFIEYAVTENRFNQAIENIVGNNPIEMKYLGGVIQWMNKDIIKEESDTLEANLLSQKDVSREVAAKTKEMFLARLNKLAGL